MNDAHAGPLQSYLDKWLTAQPLQRVGLAFVDGHAFAGHIALAALEQELLAAYAIAELPVAAIKLNWWAEELGTAAQTGGRHPLTQVLFQQTRSRTIATAHWQAPAIEAIVQLEQGTAPDFQAQLTAATGFHGALARLETLWWFGAEAASDRATRIALSTQLLWDLSRMGDEIERDRLPLPMSLLARHGLNRAGLRTASAERQRAISDQLLNLQTACNDKAVGTGPLSVFRTLQRWQAQVRIQRARRAPDALAALRRPSPVGGVGAVLQAWQAARHWRREIA